MFAQTCEDKMCACESEGVHACDFEKVEEKWQLMRVLSEALKVDSEVFLFTPTILLILPGISL